MARTGAMKTTGMKLEGEREREEGAGKKAPVKVAAIIE